MERRVHNEAAHFEVDDGAGCRLDARCRLSLGGRSDDHGADRERRAAGGGDSRRAECESEHDSHGGRDSRWRVLRSSHGEALVRRAFVGVNVPRKGGRKWMVAFALTLFGFFLFSGIAYADLGPSRPNPAIDENGFMSQKEFEELMKLGPEDNPPMVSTAGGSSGGARGGIYDFARRSGRIMPPLRSAIPYMAVTALGLDMGWRMGNGCFTSGSCESSNNFFYRHFSGDGFGQAVPANFPNAGWKWYGPGAGPNYIGAGNLSNTWILELDPSSTNHAYCTGGSCHPGFGNNGIWQVYSNVTVGQLLFVDAQSYCISPGNSCQVRYATDAQYQAAIKSDPITKTQYDNLTTTVKNTYFHTVTNNYNDTDRQNAGGALGTVGSRTAAQTDAEIDLATQADPGYNPDESTDDFLLLEPGVNEPYTEYIARLRAAGWLGTATVTEVALDEDLGPGAVHNVAIYDSTTHVATITRPWTTERIAVEFNLRFRVNPGGSGGVVPPNTTVPPTGCGPTIPPIDFSPFEDIDFTDKFPFGIFGWVGSVLSPLVASPETPIFDIPIDLPGVGDGEIHVDLSPADPYFAVLRLLGTIGLGIASMYLFATSIMGIKAGNAGGGLEDDV